MDVKINEQCDRLKSLLHTKPNDLVREEVEHALHSKWEGVQVCAARVLATWGDRQSIQALRDWLQSSLDRKSGWAVRGQAIRLLCQCYQSDDIHWLLDLYFEEENRLRRHEFLPLIISLPEPVVRRRILLESLSEIDRRREASRIAMTRLEQVSQSKQKMFSEEK
jgi:hypothetical protein